MIAKVSLNTEIWIFIWEVLLTVSQVWNINALTNRNYDSIHTWELSCN